MQALPSAPVISLLDPRYPAQLSSSPRPLALSRFPHCLPGSQFSTPLWPGPAGCSADDLCPSVAPLSKAPARRQGCSTSSSLAFPLAEPCCGKARGPADEGCQNSGIQPGLHVQLRTCWSFPPSPPASFPPKPLPQLPGSPAPHLQCAICCNFMWKRRPSGSSQFSLHLGKLDILATQTA